MLALGDMTWAVDDLMAFGPSPIASEMLERNDYYWIGELRRKIGVPVFSVLEGGYSGGLPELMQAYLKGRKQSKRIRAAPNNPN